MSGFWVPLLYVGLFVERDAPLAVSEPEVFIGAAEAPLAGVAPEVLAGADVPPQVEVGVAVAPV